MSSTITIYTLLGFIIAVVIPMYISMSYKICTDIDTDTASSSSSSHYHHNTCITPLNDHINIHIPLLNPTVAYHNLLHTLTNLPLAPAPPLPPPKRYRLIIDAGSTGSRLFIYDVSSPTSLAVIRVGSEKTTPGLSAFTSPSSAKSLKYATPSEQYMKLFRYANTLIPYESRATSTVSILATAGMRLLSPSDVSDLYESLTTGLAANPDFHYDVRDVATLPGDLEGYYGVLSSNYLLEHISATLKSLPGSTPVGSLDMGGSSTQITFDPTAAADLHRSNLFIKSYLGYGGDTMREAIWTMLAKRGAEVHNPCGFRGFVVEVRRWCWDKPTLLRERET